MIRGLPLRIATRASTLALEQARFVGKSLGEYELIRVTTAGDRDDRPQIFREGERGVFTREIEAALLRGEADIAVHSLKDLPIESRDGLVLAAIPKRESPYDVLVGASLESLRPGMRIATSSPRRAAFLRAIRNDLEIIPIRGNIDTRLRKIDEGYADGVILAEAGLARIRSDRPREQLPLELFPPAPGQGALGIQARDAGIVDRLDHAETRQAVEAERRILAAMGGGCDLALGAVALMEGGVWRIIAAFFRNGELRRADHENANLDILVATVISGLR